MRVGLVVWQKDMPRGRSKWREKLEGQTLGHKRMFFNLEQMVEVYQRLNQFSKLVQSPERGA